MKCLECETEITSQEYSRGFPLFCSFEHRRLFVERAALHVALHQAQSEEQKEYVRHLIALGNYRGLGKDIKLDAG